MQDESQPYQVEPDDQAYRVIGPSGYAVCACSDKANAEQYASLLNQAYKNGYKAGYRVAKRAAAPK